ncbi:hypothetical protein FACS189413_03630 [Bacteroidia bacterium]|nr:hypothetical protein FACS189413_03630 [Bacteroidia bacterium]
MKKIAAITMARNDEFFLNKWINYYGALLGEENLYIYLDGEDQPIPAQAGKAHIFHVKRVVEQVVKAEKRRLRYLSERAAELFKTYDLIIGCDADEFLAIDPKLGKNLVEYLSEIQIKTSVSGLGLDVGQNKNCESQLDGNQPFLAQRSYAFVSARYTKPNVIARPVRWGSGFHRIKKHTFKIDKNLYLFHFGSIDYQMISEKIQNKELVATGRKRHLNKRFRTINFITQKKAKDGEKYFPIVRFLQTVIRPVYAWNKPAMLGWKLIIELPERFKNIV